MKIKNLTGNVSEIYPKLKAELREAGLPVLVFGNSDVAIVMSPDIKKAAIHVDAVTVGDKYWKPNCQVLGQPVLPFSGAKRIFKRVNVIGCFSPLYDCVISELKDSGIVETLYLPYFDILNFFSLDTKFVMENKQKFLELNNCLVDKLSIDTLDRYISSKISGDTSILTSVIAKSQYFPGDLFRLSNEEIFVDCGAFVGDSIADFLANVRMKYRKIIAFEPDSNIFERLTQNTRALRNIELIKGGCWDSKCKLSFKMVGGGLSSVKEEQGGVCEVDFDTLDNILHGDACTYIKADIEGAEMRMLRGAESTIKAFHPKLAISVYHKNDDLLTIPQYIRNLYPDYRLALRMHHHFSDLVLYAMPNEDEMTT